MMDQKLLFTIFEEYLRSVPHPHNVEIMRKYPNLWANENIRNKLLDRYPDGRKSDDEYRQWWREQLVDIGKPHER